MYVPAMVSTHAALRNVGRGPVPVSVDPHVLQFIMQRLSVLGRRKSALAMRVIGWGTAIAPRPFVIATTILTVLPEGIPTARIAVEFVWESAIVVMDTQESVVRVMVLNFGADAVEHSNARIVVDWLGIGPPLGRDQEEDVKCAVAGHNI